MPECSPKRLVRLCRVNRISSFDLRRALAAGGAFDRCWPHHERNHQSASNRKGAGSYKADFVTAH